MVSGGIEVVLNWFLLYFYACYSIVTVTLTYFLLSEWFWGIETYKKTANSEEPLHKNERNIHLNKHTSISIETQEYEKVKITQLLQKSITLHKTDEKIEVVDIPDQLFKYLVLEMVSDLKKNSNK
jgi:hypothetical protein